MNEWLNGVWLNEGINVWRIECMNEGMNVWRIEWTNEWRNDGMYVWSSAQSYTCN